MRATSVKRFERSNVQTRYCAIYTLPLPFYILHWHFRVYLQTSCRCTLAIICFIPRSKKLLPLLIGLHCMDILHEITHHVSPPSPKQGYLSFFIINVKLNVARPGIPDNVISNDGPQITCREFAHRHTCMVVPTLAGVNCAKH